MERRPLEAKKAKIEVTLATSEASQLGQIESEFQILKSLIPNKSYVGQLKHKNIAWSFKFTTFLLKGQPGNIFDLPINA